MTEGTITAVDFRENAQFAAVGVTGLIHVWVQVDGGPFEKLFDFYRDELSFDEADLIGLTTEAARQIHLERDMEYLTS